MFDSLIVSPAPREYLWVISDIIESWFGHDSVVAIPGTAAAEYWRWHATIADNLTVADLVHLPHASGMVTTRSQYIDYITTLLSKIPDLYDKDSWVFLIAEEDAQDFADAMKKSKLEYHKQAVIDPREIGSLVDGFSRYFLWMSDRLGENRVRLTSRKDEKPIAKLVSKLMMNLAMASIRDYQSASEYLARITAVDRLGDAATEAVGESGGAASWLTDKSLAAAVISDESAKASSFIAVFEQTNSDVVRRRIHILARGHGLNTYDIESSSAFPKSSKNYTYGLVVSGHTIPLDSALYDAAARRHILIAPKSLEMIFPASLEAQSIVIEALPDDGDGALDVSLVDVEHEQQSADATSREQLAEMKPISQRIHIDEDSLYPTSSELQKDASPEMFIVRDILVGRGAGSVWRRGSGKHVVAIPKHVRESVAGMLFASQVSEYEAILRDQLVYASVDIGRADELAQLCLVGDRSNSILLPIVVACAGGQGRLNAALKIQPLLDRWKPHHVLLAGIAGACGKTNTKNNMIGKTILATSVIDLSNKRVQDGGNLANWESYKCRYAKPTHVFVNDLREKSKEFLKRPSVKKLFSDLKEVSDSAKEIVRENILSQCVEGMTLCSDSIIDAKEYKEWARKEVGAGKFDKNACGLEMEASGVVEACEMHSKKSIGGGVASVGMIKVISDMSGSGEGKAEDRVWRKIALANAAYVSLRFSMYLTGNTKTGFLCRR